MPYPMKVIIEGEEITEVEEMEISVTTPADVGRWAGDRNTGPAKLVLKRRARSQPSMSFFKHTANPPRDYLEGEIFLASSKGDPTYTIAFRQAAIDTYEFNQPELDGDLRESITMWIWEMQLSTPGGGKRTFTVDRTGDKS
jgi:hypothetical protein